MNSALVVPIHIATASTSIVIPAKRLRETRNCAEPGPRGNELKPNSPWVPDNRAGAWLVPGEQSAWAARFPG